MIISSCDGAKNNLMDSSSPSSCPPLSTEIDNQGLEKDSSVMTIEFLRARLLSERSVSKSAKQQMQRMSQQIFNLQARLDMEIEQRKKYESAMERMFKFLNAKGLSVDFLEKVEESIKEVDDHGTTSEAPGNMITKHAVNSSSLHTNGENSLGPDAHDSNEDNLVAKAKPCKPQVDNKSNIEVTSKHSSRSSIAALPGNTITKHAVNSSSLHGNGENSLSPDAHDSNEDNLVAKAKPCKPQVDNKSIIEVTSKHSSRSSIAALHQSSQDHTEEFIDKKSQIRKTTDADAKLDTSVKLKSMLYHIMEEVKTIPKEQPLELIIQGLVDNVINLFGGKDVADLCENKSKPYGSAYTQKVKDYSKHDESMYPKQKPSQTVNENLGMVTQSEKCVVTREMQVKGFDSQIKNSLFDGSRTMQDPCKQWKTVSYDSAYMSRAPCHADLKMRSAIPGSITEQAVFTNNRMGNTKQTTLRGSPYVVESPHPGVHYHPWMSYGECHEAWPHGKRNECMVKDGIIRDVVPHEFSRKEKVNMMKDGIIHDVVPHEVYKKQDVTYGNCGIHRGYAYHLSCVEGPHCLTDERNGLRLGNIFSVLQEARQSVREEQTEDLLLGSSSSSSSSSLLCEYPHPERFENLRRSRSASSNSHYNMCVLSQNNPQSREVDLGNGITLYTD